MPTRVRGSEGRTAQVIPPPAFHIRNFQYLAFHYKSLPLPKSPGQNQSPVSGGFGLVLVEMIKYLQMVFGWRPDKKVAGSPGNVKICQNLQVLPPGSYNLCLLSSFLIFQWPVLTKEVTGHRGSILTKFRNMSACCYHIS